MIHGHMPDLMDDFVRGFIRVFDWTGMVAGEEMDYTPKSDADALREDWESVGADMWTVIRRMNPGVPPDRGSE